MKTNRLKLNTLKVQSFLTSLDEKQKVTIGGGHGIVDIDTTCSNEFTRQWGNGSQCCQQ